MWAILGIISSFLLGVYDIIKKISLRDNAVVPVLFFATLTGAALFVPCIVISAAVPQMLQGGLFFVPPVDVRGHLLFMVKACIVGTSWLLSYFALKHLPITIASPIRSTGPLYTLLGALFLFGERLTIIQWAGLGITFIFFYIFSRAGRHEGISFRNNRWVLIMIVSTVIGGISGLFDKYLVLRYDRMAIQAWYSLYMVGYQSVVLLVLWLPRRAATTRFTWHPAIPLIGLVLAIADFAYFYALATPEASIAILSAIRRGSVIFSFSIGYRLFKEDNIRRKALALAGIIIGMALMLFASGR